MRFIGWHVGHRSASPAGAQATLEPYVSADGSG